MWLELWLRVVREGRVGTHGLSGLDWRRDLHQNVLLGGRDGAIVGGLCIVVLSNDCVDFVQAYDSVYGEVIRYEVADALEFFFILSFIIFFIKTVLVCS